MFKKIMVAVDLEHQEKAEKAIAMAANLAKQYGAEALMVGVTGTGFSRAAPLLEKYFNELDAFTKEQSGKHGVDFAPTPVVCADPAAELHGMLLDEIEKQEADLLVMGSHKPGMLDYLLGGHAGHMATHAPISVLVVR
ncbi:MAG: universal stress protein [Alphaproteobacteria bacterium]|nr:universal stress protein [Alphaproteobacteria bacterium]